LRVVIDGRYWIEFSLNRTFLILVLLFPSISWGDSFAARFESEFVLPLLDQTPGGALVIVENGEVAFQKVYGKRDDKNPVTDETLFRIASLSKTFASAAASILVEDTSVTWQTPLKSNLDYLKFKEPAYGQQITLRHLMSQTTGLMPHAYTNLIEENMSFKRIVDRLERVDFVCQPGRCYGYQNVVFSLVADLVEAKTEIQYPEYVQQEIFEPLHMGRASFGYSSFINDANHATPHVWTGKRWRAVRSTSHYYKVPPAAGVNASISDMREWLLAQIGEKPEVLDSAMLDTMHQGVIKTSRQQAHYPYRKALGKIQYGLGWRIFDYGNLNGLVHHGGYVKGMVSAMVFHRPSQTGMVLMLNSEPRGMNELVLNFAELYGEHFETKRSQLVSR
jgi:beta-lactamase class C